MSFAGLAAFLDRRAGIISLFFCLLAIVSTGYVVKLYANLKPDIEELLPTTSRSVRDLNEVTKRLRSIDNLAVLVFSKDSKAAGRFQDDLAKRLEQLPPTLSTNIEYKITDELHFFEKRKSLFISLDDLKEVRDFIKRKIEYEKFIYNPINLVIENKPTEPNFDFRKLEEKYTGLSDEFSHFPGGVYATPDGTKRLILIYAPDQSITTAHALRNAAEKEVQALNPSRYAPDMDVKFAGNVQDIIEEQQALLEDLLLSTVLVTLLVSFILWVYYRSFYATLALILSLLVGTIFTFGLSYFAVGYLNANSAFLGSIVMGNGINFGIMILARYLEERRKNQLEHLPALTISLRETLLATLTAALAAGLAYGSLMLTSFRGFSQFGIIGFIGMICCWTCAYTFFPAILSWFNRRIELIGKERRVESRNLWSGAIRFLLSGHAKTIAGLGLVASVIAILGVSRLDSKILETDLTKLRDKRSMETGSGFLGRYVDEILGRYSSPVAVLAHNPEEAEKIDLALKKKKKNEGSGALLGNVMRVEDFVPGNQKEKVKALRSIRELLPPKIFWHLSAPEQNRVREFTSTENMTPFSVADLPVKLLDRFREKNGNIGNLVLVDPISTDAVREGNGLIKFVKGVRETVDSVAPGIPVAGRLPVSADMMAAIVKEGPVATAVSGLAVVVLTLILFRNLELSFLVLSALFLGVAWMVGTQIWLNLKINFLNFIALPITFGIGVDYAVNVFARYREERGKLGSRDAMIQASYHTGGAVVLASLSTIIGWGSLLIAGNQAFVSFGKLAVLGEITCVTVAVLVIPALVILFRRSDVKA